MLTCKLYADIITFLQAKLTPAYLQYSMYQSLSNNTKLFFGPDIPTYLGSLLTEPTTAAPVQPGTPHA